MSGSNAFDWNNVSQYNKFPSTYQQVTDEKRRQYDNFRGYAAELPLDQLDQCLRSIGKEYPADQL